MIAALIAAFVEAGCLIEGEDEHGARLFSSEWCADIDLDVQASDAVLVQARPIGFEVKTAATHWDYDAPPATVRAIRDQLDSLQRRLADEHNDEG